MAAATRCGKARRGGSGPLRSGKAASSPADGVIADRGRDGRGRSPQPLPVDRKLDTGGLAASVERNNRNRNAVTLGAWKWIAILGAGSRPCSVGRSQNGIRRGGCVGMWRECCSVGAWTSAGPLAAVTMRGSAASRLSRGSMALQALARRCLRVSACHRLSGVSFSVLTWCVFFRLPIARPRRMSCNPLNHMTYF